MVILGGMGNTPGVILAAILLTLLPEDCAGFRNRTTAWPGVNDTRMMIYSLLLIVLMLTRPQGLFTVAQGRASGGRTIHPHDDERPNPVPLLQLEQCTIRFGGLTAVSGLDLRIGGG